MPLDGDDSDCEVIHAYRRPDLPFQLEEERGAAEEKDAVCAIPGVGESIALSLKIEVRGLQVNILAASADDGAARRWWAR